jgi:hypothetical protein
MDLVFKNGFIEDMSLELSERSMLGDWEIQVLSQKVRKNKVFLNLQTSRKQKYPKSTLRWLNLGLIRCPV